MKCSNCRKLHCQKTDTDTDTGTLSRIGPGKRYTLRVNWPGFKGLKHLCQQIQDESTKKRRKKKKKKKKVNGNYRHAHF